MPPPSPTTDRVSPQEIDARLSALRTAMERTGITAYVAFNPDNIYYLTNFANFIHERPFILVVTARSHVFIVPLLELAHVERHQVGDPDLRDYTEFPAVAGERWVDRLRDVLPAQGIVGIEGVCPSWLRDSINNPTRVVDLIDSIREIKSAHEIARIAWTSDVMTSAFKLMLGELKRGAIVANVCGNVAPYFARRCLGEISNYNVMSSQAAGFVQPPRFTDDPHNFSCITAECAPGGPFLGLIAGRLNGYGAEIERTVFLEHIPEDTKRPFATMLEMRRKAFELLKPGAIGSEIDAACQAIARKAGYTRPLHRTGHSFGVTGHEAPFLAKGEDNLIQPGMVFSIEPGIYIPGEAGYRHSDTVLVTDSGYLTLTNYPEDAEDLVVT